MEYTCSLNDSQDTCTLRHVGAPGWVKEMETARSEDRISARRCNFCISIRSMNWLNLDTSKMRLLKNVISISLRPAASILATRDYKYALITRRLRRVRAGRIMRSPGGKGKTM